MCGQSGLWSESTLRQIFSSFEIFSHRLTDLVVDHQLHHPHTLSPGRPARVRDSQGLSVSSEKCLRQVSPAPCLDGRTDLNHVGVTEVVVYSPPTGSLLWDCCVSSPGYSLRDISLLIQSLYSVEEMKRPNVL